MNAKWTSAHEPHARARDIALFCENAKHMSVGEHRLFATTCADSEFGQQFTRAMVYAAVAEMEAA